MTLHARHFFVLALEPIRSIQVVLEVVNFLPVRFRMTAEALIGRRIAIGTEVRKKMKILMTTQALLFLADPAEIFFHERLLLVTLQAVSRDVLAPQRIPSERVIKLLDLPGRGVMTFSALPPLELGA